MTTPRQPDPYEEWRRFQEWKRQRDSTRAAAPTPSPAPAPAPAPAPSRTPRPPALGRDDPRFGAPAATQPAQGEVEPEPRRPAPARPSRPQARGRDLDTRPGFYEEQEANKGPVRRFFEENTRKALTINPITNTLTQLDRALQPGRGDERLRPSTAERLPEIGSEAEAQAEAEKPWWRQSLVPDMVRDSWLPERLRRVDRASAVGGGTALDLLGGAANTLGMERLGTTLRQAGQDIQRSHASKDTETSWQDVKKDRTNLEPFVIGALGKGIGTMAPIAVATAVNPALGFGAGWAMGTGEVRNETEELGIKQEHRDVVALAGGAVIGALDRLGASRAAAGLRRTIFERFAPGTAAAVTHQVVKDKAATGFLTGIKNIFVAGAKGAGEEFLTEGAQEGVGYVASRAPFGREMKGGELLERMEEGAMQGLVAGGGITTATATPSEVGRQLYVKQVEQAVKHVRALEEAEAALAAEQQAANEEVAGLQAARQGPPDGAAPAGTAPETAETASEAPPTPTQPPEASEGPQEGQETVESENRRLRDEARRSQRVPDMGNELAYQEHVARLDREGWGKTVGTADVGQLKQINDRVGRASGDQRILQAGQALRQAAEELGHDPRAVSHITGDEFAVVLEGDGRDAEVEAILKRAEELAGEVEIPGHPVKSKLTWGVGVDLDAADRQMGERKLARGDGYQRGVTVEGPTEVPGVGPVEGLAASIGTYSLPTGTILADPERFQFKDVLHKLLGVSNALRDVTKWDPDAAGVVLVWKDPENGRVYVVNGHHRLDLAKRLGVERINVRFSDAKTATEARTQGALINMKEGRGTPVDVAKIMRESGITAEGLAGEGVSLREGLVEKGSALARLDDDLFQSVTTGRISEAVGQVIGRETDDPATQHRIIAEFRTAGRLNAAEMTEVARQVVAEEVAKRSQITLFGTNEEEVSLYVPKARLVVALRRKLGNDRRVFGWVSKEGRAEELEKVGDTKIDVEAASEIAKAGARLEALFKALYERGGPVAQAVNDGARRVLDGERPADVARDIYEAVRDGLLSDSTTTGEQGGSASPAGTAVEGSREAESAPAQEVVPAGDTRGLGVQYHGSTTTEFVPDEGHYATLNFYGQGVYSTDATDITRGYADRNVKRGGEPGAIFKVTPNRPLEILDFEAPIPAWFVEAIEQGTVYDAGLGEVALGENPTNLREFYDAMRLSSKAEGVSADTVQESWTAFQELFIAKGYGGFRHIGGLQTKKQPHNVVVYFNPAHVDITRLAEAAPAQEVAPARPAQTADQVLEGEQVADSQDESQDTLFLETMEGPVPAGIAEVMADPRTRDSRDIRQDNIFAVGETSLDKLTNQTAAELLDLRAQLKAEKDPRRRSQIAARVAAAEALVHRDQKITVEELAARAAAEREADGPDDAADHRQGSLFSPANRSDDFGVRLRRLLNLEPGRPKDQIKALIQIAKQLENALVGQGHSPVFKGRLGRIGKMARGYFRTYGEGIWVRRADMIGTIAHEYGHSISKLILGWPTRRAKDERANWSRIAPPVGFPKAIRDELVKLGKQLYGDRKPAGGYGEEGIAETFRYYVLDPDLLRQEAPNVYAWLEGVFEQDPDFAAPWKAAQAEMQAYGESSLIEQVGAQISVNERIRFTARMRDLVRWVFDESHELRLAVREISELKGQALAARANAFLLKRLLPGVDSMAQDWIEFGGFRRNAGKLERVTRPIKKAFDLVKPERLNHFRYYLVGMSGLDRYAHAITQLRRREAEARGQNPDFVPRGTHTDVLNLDQASRRWLETNYAPIMKGGLEGHVGITIDQAEAVVPPEWAHEFKDAAEIIWENERALIEYRLGVSLDRNEANAILKSHPHHVAFAREFDPNELSVASRSDAGTAGTGVARQKGSGRRILDPIESILKNPFQTMRDVHSREILQLLAEQSMTTEGGDRIMSEVENPKEAVRAILRNFSTEQLLDAFLKMGLQLPPEAAASKKGLREWLDSNRNVAFQLFLEVGHARALEQRDAVIPILMRDGSKRWFRLQNRELYDLMARQPVIDSPGVRALKVMLRPAHAVTRSLRIGATTTVEFGGVNLMRDLVTAAMYSKARVTIPGTNIWLAPAQLPVAVYRMMSGVSSLLKQDEWFQRFRIDRGDLASFQLQDRKEVQKRMREFYRSQGAAARLYYVVRHPVDTLRVITSVSEQANRIGEYKAVYARAVSRGESEQNARLKAGFAAREVTQDFAKMGTATREYNKLSAFFAAFIGGWSKFGEEAFRKIDPEMESMQVNDEKGWVRAQQFWTGAAALITLPTLALYYAQKDDPAYMRIPRWKRAAFWSWVHRGNDRGPGWDGYGSGKPERIYLLPKPPLIGHLFGTIPELMAEMALKGNNNKPAEAALSMLMNQVNPFELPVLARPLVENAFDHSLFFDRPIEGPRLSRLPMNERYDQRTSSLAIALSNTPLLGGMSRTIPGVREVIGSPKRLENLIRGYTGGVGGYALEGGGKLVDAARSIVGAEAYNPRKAVDARPLAARLVGTRRFVNAPPGMDAETVQTFYEEYEKKEQHFNAWEARRAQGKVAGAQAYLDKHRQDINDLATTGRSGRPGPWRSAMNEINQLRNSIRKYEAVDTEASKQKRDAAIARIQRIAETRIGVVQQR